MVHQRELWAEFSLKQVRRCISGTRLKRHFLRGVLTPATSMTGTNLANSIEFQMIV